MCFSARKMPTERRHSITQGGLIRFIFTNFLTTNMVSIEKAKSNDFDSVFRLLLQLWPNKGLTKRKTNELYSYMIKSNNTISLVVREGNCVIGYAAIVCRTDIESQGKIGYLSELIIDEQHREKGIGTKFIEEIIVQAKRKGCVEIQFTSSFWRKKAHKLYKSLGFNKTAYLFWKKI